MLEWNTYLSDINKRTIIVFNVFKHYSFYEDLKKIIKKCKTIEDFNFRLDENGLPLIEDCVTHNFQDYHFIAGFSSAYRNFYENIANIQDKFVEFWKKVVTRFK